MAGFKFRLEKILQLKLSEESQIKLQLAAIRARMKIVEQEIAKLENQIVETGRNLAENCATGMNGLELQQWRLFIEMLNSLLNKKKEELAKIVEEEEQIRQRFLSVRRERRTMEKLKIRKFSAYLFEQDRVNRLYLDEVALRKFTYGGGRAES